MHNTVIVDFPICVMAAATELLAEETSTLFSLINHSSDANVDRCTTCSIRVNAECNVTSSSQIDMLPSSSFPHSDTVCLPCLPVSKGCIKKTAQTRFVNSSPRSYRLMPASAESSDKTSFVEKSPHNPYLPMKFMLEVAELWKVSKRSELECNFTLAKSENIIGSEYYIKEAKQRSPICHSTVLPTQVHRVRRNREKNVDMAEEIMRGGLGRDLLAQIKCFFKSQELKERHPMGIAGLIKMEFQRSEDLEHKEGSIVYSEETSVQHDDSESNFKTNLSLTPLVKRLSVSGLDEATNSGTRYDSSRGLGSFVHEQGRPLRKMHASTKRPKSGKPTDQDEEPLQKRAYCKQSSMDGSIQTG